jgi:hypothetical protein
MRNWCRRSRAGSGYLASAGSDNPSASMQAMTSSEGFWRAAGTSPMQRSRLPALAGHDHAVGN